MAIVNQQLEDNNNHGAGGSTSSVHEIARVDASDDRKKIITLEQEEVPVIDDLATFSTLTKAEMERVTVCKETLWPMICEINAKQQNFLSMVKEKFGLDLTRNSGNRASTSASLVFQLRFLNGISTPVSTGLNIEGKNHKPFVVALVDQSSGQIVSTGAEAATEVEIVVLEGDCNDVESENWTSDEFNNKIIREWKGRKVLQGNPFVKLKEGIVSVNKISFTHNSAWKGNRFCRLGARSVDAVFATRVKEAKTESFPVMDKRKLLYNKHSTPSLSDHVYRLHKINKRSACYNRLKEASIKTVMDLRTFNAINPERLQDIIKIHPNTWKIIMDHVQMCKDDTVMYLYHYPRDGQKRDGVVFNVFGQLVGLVADSQFLPSNKLPSNKMAYAQKLVMSATQHWGEVVPFINEASLINHLQSNSFPNGLLNLVIPHDTPSENEEQEQEREEQSFSDVAVRRNRPSFRNAVLEVMKFRTISKYMEPVLEPLIRRVVKKEVEMAIGKHISNMNWDGEDDIESFLPKKLQLQFLSALSLPVFTGTRIEGGDCNMLKVALIDAHTGKTISSRIESSAKVEIVVLEGDFDDDFGENWTLEEFNANIVKERREKKPLLNGNVVLNLKKGIGLVGDIFFTDNSSWTRSRKFKLGARVLDKFDGSRVREAKSKSFVVRDRRGDQLYKKHHPPYLSDEVWRLEKIGKDGAFHKRLNKEKVETVKDFLVLYYLDPAMLRHILGSGMSARMWEVAVEHATGCVIDDNKLYLYCPESQKRDGVVFNVVGQVLGLFSDCKYVGSNKLSETEKVEAHKLVISASQHVDKVLSYDDEASLRTGTCSFNPKGRFDYPQMNAPGSGTCSFTKDIGNNYVPKRRCNYPQMNAPSPDIIVPTGLGEYGLNQMGSMGSMDVRFDEVMDFEWHVDNTLIWDPSSSMHLQYLGGSSSPGDLQCAVDRFLFPCSGIGKARRRWTILSSVVKWFSLMLEIRKGDLSSNARLVDENTRF